jgi:hypothetical protein
MIDIQIIKLDESGHKCDGLNYKKNPEYFYCILGSIYHLRTGSTVAEIVLNNSDYEYYCRDCIDDLYVYIKSRLDTKLWIFH